MAKLSPKELAKWEASRDIGAEILRGLKQVRSGRATRVHHIEVPQAHGRRSLTADDRSQATRRGAGSACSLSAYLLGGCDPAL